jgi:hypothetical protein
LFFQPGFSRLPVCHQFQLVESVWQMKHQPASAGFSLLPSGNPAVERINPCREARLKPAENDDFLHLHHLKMVANPEPAEARLIADWTRLNAAQG